MDNMVERIANAIEELRWANALRTVQHGPRASMDENREYARAALEALLEPSQAMLLAMADFLVWWEETDEYSSKVAAEKFFGLLVDTALAEPSSSGEG